MQTIVLHLSGLACGHCVANTQKALQAVAGVISVEVSREQAVVKGNCTADVLIKAVENAGYHAKQADDAK